VHADYHEGHAKLGISQAEQLDPDCGVSALDACLKAQRVLA